MTLSHDNFDPAAVLQTAAESIIVTTTELVSPGPRIVYANQAFERMTGWTAAEIIGQSPRVLQGEKTDRAIFANMAPLIRSGHCWQGQTVNYRKDGSEFMMEWSINPLVDAAGLLTHYVAVQRDVTARVKTEERIREAQRARQEADRKKFNLARYFSPRTVEVLADRNQPLGKVRRQNVAVLMVDIVGFTTLCEKLSPERVVALLRSFYRRMAVIIFDHDGSIEHFAGDSLLAIFGVPDEGSQDAGNALACAIRMKSELARWNEKRLGANRDKIDVGISAHYGTVVLGDIGFEKATPTQP